jgi:hypothetical protein
MNLSEALEQKCKECIVINNWSDCPFYSDCIREVKTGMRV